MDKKLSQEEIDSIARARESILGQARIKTEKSKKRIEEAKKKQEEKEKPKEKPKEEEKEDAEDTTETEIVAVISMSDYEKAGGDISKILNNTPENLFASEVDETEEYKLQQEPLEVNKSIRMRRFGKIVTLGDEEVEKRRTIIKEIEPKEVDEYATSIIEEERKNLFAKLTSLSSGEVIDICKTIFTIGISQNCDLVIDQTKENHTVSRNHATIIFKNDMFFIRDTSSNGTFTGNYLESFYRLPKGNEVELKNGQYVKFADQVYKFERERS